MDDIDHLGNRRVRAVGELLENQFRLGLVRMERAIKEKMSVYQEMSTAMPHDLINAKPVMAAIREFFGSSQLSQFMDQTNPLSEITHKRRLVGPGTRRPLARTRGIRSPRRPSHALRPHLPHRDAGRPQHRPHFFAFLLRAHQRARLHRKPLPQSPRRPDRGLRHDYALAATAIGAWASTSRWAKSRRPTKNWREKKRKLVEHEPFSFYLSAWEEDQHIIAQANVPVDEKGRIIHELVNARQAGNFVLKRRDEIDYIDVSPKQLVSVAASLIPFLENDDANRALMGSNMQRQSVPLLRAQAPLIGTGMEEVTARDSGAVVICKRNGIVDSVDSERIIVRVEGDGHSGQFSREVGADIYQLTKFRRSNQNTCINQKPAVP